MKNFVQPGDTLTCNAPYALAAGDGCKVGLVFGIACAAAALNNPVELKTTGVYDITALATDTASGTVPVAAYWDDTNKRVTTTASSHQKIGVIVAAKLNGDTTARVRLNGTF